MICGHALYIPQHVWGGCPTLPWSPLVPLLCDAEKTNQSPPLASNHVLQQVDSDRREIARINEQLENIHHTYDPLAAGLKEKLAKKESLLQLLQTCKEQEKDMMTVRTCRVECPASLFVCVCCFSRFLRPLTLLTPSSPTPTTYTYTYIPTPTPTMILQHMKGMVNSNMQRNFRQNRSTASFKLEVERGFTIKPESTFRQGGSGTLTKK